MATTTPGRPSVFDMQPYPIHADWTSFVQPNEARHIQTSVSGIRQKTRRTLPARDEHLAGVADTGARCARSASGDAHARAKRIFTIKSDGKHCRLPTADYFHHKIPANVDWMAFVGRFVGTVGNKPIVLEISIEAGGNIP